MSFGSQVNIRNMRPIHLKTCWGQYCRSGSVCSLWLLYDILSLKNDVNVRDWAYGTFKKWVISKKNLEKIYFLLPSWRSPTKVPGSGVGSGSVSQRYGSADPDPYQIRIRNTGWGWIVDNGQTSKSCQEQKMAKALLFISDKSFASSIKRQSIPLLSLTCFWKKEIWEWLSWKLTGRTMPRETTVVMRM